MGMDILSSAFVVDAEVTLRHWVGGMRASVN